MLTQIVLHTPKWVFAIFALLVWIGVKQLFATRVSLGRVTLMPIAMTGLSVWGVISAFGETPMPILGWAVAAAAVLALVLQRPVPAGTRYDAAARAFHLAGSAVPLVLMMAIFLTKYVVAVLFVMHPELRHQPLVAVAIGTLYGTFSGIFTGRAIRLWRLAMRADRTGFAA